MGSSQCRAQEIAVGEQKTGGFDISGQVFHLTLNLEFGEVLKIGYRMIYIHMHSGVKVSQRNSKLIPGTNSIL
jgi:hypothetical protein